MDNSHTDLKGLQGQKQKLLTQLNTWHDSKREADSNISSIKAKIKSIDERITNLSKRDVVISEHAILRYIERFYGLDIEALKKQILTDGARSQIMALGDGQFPVDGCKLVVKNNTVVTVVD